MTRTLVALIALLAVTSAHAQDGQRRNLVDELLSGNRPIDRLMWALRAYRCGNPQGAIAEWTELAGEDDAVIADLARRTLAVIAVLNAEANYVSGVFAPGRPNVECRP